MSRHNLPPAGAPAGIALVAVLVALTLLLLLALPFTIGMSIGYGAAVHSADNRTADEASQSARDLLLSEAALGHPALDATPSADGLSEYPSSVSLPPDLKGLTEDDRVRLGGEVYDLQRRIDLDTATPLLLANLIGTACRLGEDLDKEASSMVLDDGGALPEQGFVLVDLELIHYGKREGNVLSDLQRGLMAAEKGYDTGEEHGVAKGALVLDYRCVTAVCWPFEGKGDGQRRTRQPFANVAELAQIGQAGFGAFTAVELETFARNLCVGGGHRTAPLWGRPERVFDELDPAKGSRTLRIESGLHTGAGATVRLRDLKTGVVEYGLVVSTSTPRQGGARDLQLPSEFRLVLNTPVLQAFPAIDTVVEPLVPVPVNVNTASAEVLVALFRSLQRAMDVRVHEGQGQARREPPPPISRSEAQEFAEQLLMLRQDGDTGEPSANAFSGWQDFVERFFKPLLDAADSRDKKDRLLLVYRNLLTGRDARLEMGTLPICFASGPWVHYRAAASVSRVAEAPSVAARMEREGTAVALPGLPLEDSWRTQDVLDEALRLDRRTPGWITTPVNTGAVVPGEAGNDPASRVAAHLLALAYPELGLGQTRFPSKDEADSGFTPSPASTPASQWMGELITHDSFALSLDPRGRDLSREGDYLARNTGPRERGASAQPQQGGGHDRVSFPFTAQGGVCGRFGTSFWMIPDSYGNACWFDYSDGDTERNRLWAGVKDGNLLLEVLDEAGLDPDPSQSTTQVQRTAGQWTVPLSELGVSGGTPLHVNLAAYGNQAGQLSMLLDGFPRGKAKYRTYLSGSLPVFDPTQNPGLQPGIDPSRYIDIAVESTDGFPPQGVLRIGLELFEYTAINGSSFRCTFQDSMGGRLARQVATEFRPDIPTDKNGDSTVDMRQLQQQGINIDVAPEHPSGTAVELYGYALPPSSDTVFRVGESGLTDPIGGFAVARGYIRNGSTITAPLPNGGTRNLGTGIDLTSTKDIELYDPLANKRPDQGTQSQEVADAFPLNGGYVLLIQQYHLYQAQFGNAGGTSVPIGGMEVIKYQNRQGNKLTGITRNAQLPGLNEQIKSEFYDGTARQFVTDWDDAMTFGSTPPQTFDEAPLMMLWVVPISLPVQSPSLLADPQTTGMVEWLQLYPKDDENNTEFVRYDAIIDQRHVVRSNRHRWDRVRFQLTRQVRVENITVGQLGANGADQTWLLSPWNTVTATAGYIGYIPQLEATYAQIHAARTSLIFRGDCGTSSHQQSNSIVLPCHRLQLHWGNYNALTGRAGRQDRVALVAGSQASGTGRPPVEWHTVNWVWRRFDSDLLQNDQMPAEVLGPYAFQLVGFKERVVQLIQGPASNEQQQIDTRLLDRMIKFPSGELPAAYCAEVAYGATVGNSEAVRGALDELHVTLQTANDLVVEEAFAADARSFRVRQDGFVVPAGFLVTGGDETARFPPGGGLVQIDGEILAYQTRAAGEFTLANSARGLLGTEPKDHDRGAVVHFLTHVPAAILAASTSAQGDSLTLQALGAMPAGRGAVLCNNEVLHYTWVRTNGDQGNQASLEMPRYYLPGEDSSRSRGLLRGRFGTAPGSMSQGDVAIAFPIRYWDRHQDQSEDPELHYFQLSSMLGPVFWKSIDYQQETSDARVEVECLLRVDGRPAFGADPETAPQLRRIQRLAGDDKPSLVALPGSLLEARFSVIYKTGCLDLQTHLQHGYKTTAKVKNVRVEYEGEGCILDEKVTTR